jgi:hypothetical protein
MRRVLLTGAVLGVVLVVAWQRAEDDPAIRVGPWHGETSQGYPMSFVVNESDGDLTLDEWQVRVDLRCEATGRLLRVALLVGMPVPIADRRFTARHAGVTMWNSWSGDFPAEDGARGSFGTVWPVLIGEELEELRSEKCSATDLAWRARPGEPDEDVADAPADVHLRVGFDAQPAGSRDVLSRIDE